MSCPCCTSASNDFFVDAWVRDGGVIVIIYGMIVCLWGLGEVCDRFFVPSLKIMCDELEIPDNVAGATFMAGGASSPELFVSFLGLFVSKSSIGIGTIIGSEIFNHMCISAGSVFWAEGGVLKLDPKILTREVLAYMSGLVLLVWVLEGNSFGVNTIFDKGAWSTTCLSIRWQDAAVLIGCYGIYALIAGNYNKVCLVLCGSPPVIKTINGEDDTHGDDVYRLYQEQNNSKNSKPVLENQTSSKLLNSELSSSVVLSLSRQFDQSGKRDIYGVRIPGSMSVKLNTTSSKLDQSTRDIVAAVNEAYPSKEQNRIEEDAKDESDIHGHGDFLAVPEGRVWIVLHYLVLPLKYLLFYSTPDVLLTENRRKYPGTIIASIVWLALLAEGLLECLEILGNLMHVSPAVMGLTFSAIGTSLPNIWSSMIVARQGGGDMAIAAALGANTFNIYLGLGIPYLAYTLSTRQNYDSLKDDGIVLLILILLLILVVWYAAIILSGWEIRMWMGYVYVAVYLAVIIYCVLEVS